MGGIEFERNLKELSSRNRDRSGGTLPDLGGREADDITGTGERIPLAS